MSWNVAFIIMSLCFLLGPIILIFLPANNKIMESKEKDIGYFDRVIHHEVFHVIYDTFKEIFDENTWSSYNPKEFNYAECSTCTKKIGLETYSNPSGFITEYSQSTAAEDMAEVFSHLMYGSLPNTIDPILKKKIEFIKDALLKIDDDFIL